MIDYLWKKPFRLFALLGIIFIWITAILEVCSIPLLANAALASSIAFFIFSFLGYKS